MKILKELRKKYPDHKFESKIEILIDNERTGIYYKNKNKATSEFNHYYEERALLDNIKLSVKIFLDK